MPRGKAGAPDSRFRILGFKISGFGIKVSVFGFGISGYHRHKRLGQEQAPRFPGSGPRVQGFRVSGSGFRVSGSEFRVSGSEFRGSGFVLLGYILRAPGSGFWAPVYSESRSHRESDPLARFLQERLQFRTDQLIIGFRATIATSASGESRRSPSTIFTAPRSTSSTICRYGIGAVRVAPEGKAPIPCGGGNLS